MITTSVIGNLNFFGESKDSRTG